MLPPGQQKLAVDFPPFPALFKDLGYGSDN